MKSEKFTFLVVENAIDVCEGIERRMKPFENWESLGYCTGVKEASEKIKSSKPHLIYMDWGLNGGSAFEVLQHIQNLAGYNPYIIFNTGFQSDHPDIPQEIINRYKVDKYIVKPFWENLRQNLPTYLKEAEEKVRQLKPKLKTVWVQNNDAAKIQIPLNKLICITQHPNDPRKRDFYLITATKKITIPMTWQQCYDLLNANEIEYFITKSRGHLVVKEYIEKFERPFIRLTEGSFRVEVAKKKIREFEEWLGTNHL